MAASSYDPNFEFDAPKFHDFNNPCQDENVDDFFDTCNHELLPTGESSKQHVTAQQQGEQIDADEESHRAEMQDANGEEAADATMRAEEEPATENMNAAEAQVDTENAPVQTRASLATAPLSGAKSASKSAAPCKVNSKLTENILALASFKGKEAELTQIALSTVAGAASVSSPSNGEGPVASRTRSSLEGSNSKSQGVRRSQGSARKGGPSPGAALRKSASKAPQSEDKKRAHKAGASTTPFKSFAKKPRTEEESKTPIFSRFGGSRGRTAGVSSTPNGRSSSAPASGQTPRSSRKMDVSASPSLLRPTSASIAHSASASRLRQSSSSSSVMRLTVPNSPKFATASRARKRGVQGDSSAESLGIVSAGSLHSLSRQSIGGVPGSARKLTVPKSPKLRSVSRLRQSVTVSTEDAKMREALEAVENLKKRRKLGEARLKNVLDSKVGGGKAHSTKTLTVPQEPNFTERSRAKNLDSSVSSNASEGELPFAERMAKLERNGGGRSKTPVSRREGPPRLTEPKTPKFSSFQKRAPKVKSYAELEEEALQEAKRSQFKARPVNRTALESCGDVGVPKVMRKVLTQPASPKLRSAMRSGRSQSSSMDSLSSLSESSLNSLSSFKARRVPKATHQRPASAAVPSQKKLTIPKSPKLSSTYRQRSTSVSATSSEEELANSFKALDMPDLSRKFVPKHDSTKLTEPTPFRLTTDARHAAKEAQFKARQEAEAKAAEDARRYKANPVRTTSDLTSLGVNSVSKRPLTEPKPFVLQSEAKHEHASLQWQSRVERELAEEKTKFGSFHARPVPKVVGDSSKVYTPRRSGKPLTEVHDFHLNVDRRSQTHQQLSERKAERERKMEAEKAAEEARRKEEEAREIRNMRRSMVVKAKPVPTSVYNGGPAVVHSSKPLTEPMSPHFRTDMRLRSART